MSSDVSPDGSSILFHLPTVRSDEGTWNLWTIPITGGTPTLVRQDAGFATYGPDGAIAFIDHPKGLAGESIWVMDADGSNARALVEGGSYEWPRMSPDGSQVAYEELGIVYVVNVANGKVTEVGFGSEPSWFDDDTLIVD